MLLLLEVIATANKTASRVRSALVAWRHSEAFPMKVHMPLMMTVFAQLTCSGYAPCTAADAPDASFEVPAGYTRQDLAEILAESVSVAAEPGARAPVQGAGAPAGDRAGSMAPDIAY